ncbi:MAG: peptide-methionine (S)-S-oxide reductase [Candidatus Levybacteria bacterium RIFCSPHIGHO2_01_FULL_36_15]|nr:MAG: peptide-methionine (S)-S-oxide reductase [Candidatus Levybacteria bacterium RIFCSPHIGHO2_01_FULL_36_15]
MKAQDNKNEFQVATLAGGCFWCTDALFNRIKGVISVVPGYAGGKIENPSYEEVGSGDTGHAEAIQIILDPKTIPYEKLLEVFWHTHDPTTLNRQGADTGTQYRSVIFYHNQMQKNIALVSREKIKKEGLYKDPIVTEIVPFTNFYEAEENHKRYYEKNHDYPYCAIVIDPKIQKLINKFGKEVKEEYK